MSEVLERKDGEREREGERTYIRGLRELVKYRVKDKEGGRERVRERERERERELVQSQG